MNIVLQYEKNFYEKNKKSVDKSQIKCYNKYIREVMKDDKRTVSEKNL